MFTVNSNIRATTQSERRSSDAVKRTLGVVKYVLKSSILFALAAAAVFPRIFY